MKRFIISALTCGLVTLGSMNNSNSTTKCGELKKDFQLIETYSKGYSTCQEINKDTSQENCIESSYDEECNTSSQDCIQESNCTDIDYDSNCTPVSTDTYYENPYQSLEQNCYNDNAVYSNTTSTSHHGSHHGGSHH